MHLKSSPSAAVTAVVAVVAVFVVVVLVVIVGASPSTNARQSTSTGTFGFSQKKFVVS